MDSKSEKVEVKVIFGSISESETQVGGLNDEPFSDALDRYMKETDVNNTLLSQITGININTVSRLRGGKREPNVRQIVSICVALKLPQEKGFHLLKSAGIELNRSKEHRMYNRFISVCGTSDLTIEKCNRILTINELKAFSDTSEEE